MNSIVHIAHTTIQFPQNIDTFLCRFSYLVKSSKNASIFCGFLCNMEKLQSCNSCYKRFTEKSQTCNRAGEKDRLLSHNSIHIYIYIYIYTYKGAAKGAASGAALGSCVGELHLGATSELCCRCGSYTLPLSSYKNSYLKNSIFFLFNKKPYFLKRDKIPKIRKNFAKFRLQKSKENKKGIDFPKIICYNIDTVRERKKEK